MMRESGFLERRIGSSRFVVYVPDVESGQPLPAILFLHGRGECGTDNLQQLSVGLPLAVMKRRSDWPFLIVIPQKPDYDLRWAECHQMVNDALDLVEKEFHPDHSHRYITGLSQGGCGTFELAAHCSWRFAAAAPICGFTDRLDLGADFQGLPVWAFHGLEDDVVPPQQSELAIQQILEAGGFAKLTLLAGVDHNSWDYAYQESELAKWLLSHHLV